MRKLFLLVAIYLVSFAPQSKAQQLSKEYLDSVNDFFKEWVEKQNDFVYVVTDNASSYKLRKFFLSQINRNSLFKYPCIIHKKKIEDKASSTENYDLDSITLTENEAQSVLEQLQESRNFTWSQAVFPTAEIIDSSQSDSMIHSISSNLKLMGHLNPGIWTIGPPYFFRSGTLALLYYVYDCGNDCGYFSLSVYKKEKGHWQKFGSLINSWF